MAKKLKRVDGVSNRKVARAPAQTRADKNQSRAVAGKTMSDPERQAPGPDRSKVAKRRRSAAGKARPEIAATPVAKEKAAPRKAKKPESLAKAAKRVDHKEKKGAGGQKETRREKTRWNWRTVSPRTVVIVILFVVFIALSASPVARNFDASGKLRAMERELADQQKTTKSLQKEVAQARSLEYIEQEARRQRMVGPGEVLYLVTTDQEGPKVEFKLKALQSMDEAWERVRQMLHCTASRQANEP
ncbi:MAG: FtsB family cell division protein [Candidatus Geothermincolia bacterium]